jgi:hypothetical protein
MTKSEQSAKCVMLLGGLEQIPVDLTHSLHA